MKSVIIILFFLFNNILNEYYTIEDFYKDVQEKGLYYTIFNAFCLGRDVGLYTCVELFKDPFLCEDLITNYMNRDDCWHYKKLTLSQICSYLGPMISEDTALKAKYSDRQIQILISKIKNGIQCPANK